MPRSIAVRHPSTIRITSLSQSIITAGGSIWPKASRSMTVWKSGLPKGQSSRCPPSPLKVTPMVHHTRTRVPMPRNSRINMRTGPSMVASGTICPKKLRKPLPRPSLMSTPSIYLSRQRNPNRIVRRFPRGHRRIISPPHFCCDHLGSGALSSLSHTQTPVSQPSSCIQFPFAQSRRHRPIPRSNRQSRVTRVLSAKTGCRPKGVNNNDSKLRAIQS